MRLIIENPYSESHYLRRYWCYKPSIIDYDRRESGDFFKKPTQYWFLNCEPSTKFTFGQRTLVDNALDCKNAIKCMTQEIYSQTGASSRKVARSTIHSDYANTFITKYVL